MQIDEKEIRKTIGLMKPNGELFEVRLISNKGNFVLAGYFDDVEKVIDELDTQQDDYSVYITLNHLNSALKSRQQYNCLMQIKGKMNTTADNDVDGIEWLMIDLDCKRPTNVSSSEEELSKAKIKANKIYEFMSNIGFEIPLSAYSGNGVHLLYKLKLANTPDNVKLVENCLKTLGMLFTDECVEVDQKVFNPARISKLYGTIANKGRHTEERPHRMSKINGSFDNGIKATDIEYLKKLIKLMPQTEAPKKYNNYNPAQFDVEEWMRKFGIHYKKANWSDGDKYILDCCPFDSSHKGKDACIFHSRNGALGFLCFHNSCSGKTWKDVRLHFEPDAYEKREMEKEYKQYHSFNRNAKPEVHIEQQENKPIFLSALDIFNEPQVEESFVKTGISEIDTKMRGLIKPSVSVLSGLRASGKTSVLSMIQLNAIDCGNNVACFSGELGGKQFMKWMNLMAAGKNHVKPTNYENFYTVSDDNRKKIAEWLDGKFWLYNNEYGNDSKAVLEQFEKAIVEHKLDLLILDNLMAFDVSGYADTMYEQQTQFMWAINKLSRKYNVAIIIVAHPRKAMGFLRLDDISGTANIGNIVDNAFIIHRNNRDFKAASKVAFGWSDGDYIYEASNVIEIAKDRDGTNVDVFVPLYYEVETKRLKNTKSENKAFGWLFNENERKISSTGGYEEVDMNKLPWEE